MVKYKEYISYIVIVIIVVLVRSFIVTPIMVHGQSMYDTLSGNEIMLLWKKKDIKRFDIVVAEYNPEHGNKETLIKSVYALPNETIKCENGIIYINDKKLEDNYEYGHTNDFEAITLKEDEYFLMGDNREVSLDSRYFGPIRIGDIKGTTDFIIYPFNKIGKVQ
jgi:signal peptidase I